MDKTRPNIDHFNPGYAYFTSHSPGLGPVNGWIILVLKIYKNSSFTFVEYLDQDGIVKQNTTEFLLKIYDWTKVE